MISIFDIFTIGIGPSSSHTVGPMRAARLFVSSLRKELKQVASLKIEVFGSLACTGKAHGTDKALLMGLSGVTAETADPISITKHLEKIRLEKNIRLLGKHLIPFIEETHLIYNRKQKMTLHPNGMRFTAYNKQNKILSKKLYFSVGGGFVVSEENNVLTTTTQKTKLPYPFDSSESLLLSGKKYNKKIHEMILENEKKWREPDEIRRGLLKIWSVMQNCVRSGMTTNGVLPGSLKLQRRAPQLYENLQKNASSKNDPLNIMDWIDLYALAVSEENAAGGRVVTAPTNGAAGIIPAVLHYYTEQYLNPQTHSQASLTRFLNDKIAEFLLTAGAIGILYKTKASISGAEVGCQGEIGVACSMAAAGLCAVLEGTNKQIENAAEIGMEHNLGLTCDPVGGLVQIPCIERNAMGAIKAINAARIALRGDGSHKVSLDNVIQTMMQTGKDMQLKYKETSRGGLAINCVTC